MPAENAAAFDEWARQGAGARMEDAHAFAGKRVLDRIAIGYDESFIDLGCGNGWATRYVASKVQTIGLCVGVDVSEELINEARRLSAGKYPIKFLVAPLEAVPFGEAAFNHAFSMEALYYVKDPLAALQSVWRMLKSGGHLHLVIDYYKENPLSAAWQDDIKAKMHYLAQDEWVELFQKAGFAEVAAERILDERPVPEDMKFPWGGFQTREDLATFRSQVGSLYIRGRKAELSHALDPYLDRASAELGREASGAPAPGAPRRSEKRKKRLGLF